MVQRWRATPKTQNRLSCDSALSGAMTSESCSSRGYSLGKTTGKRTLRRIIWYPISYEIGRRVHHDVAQYESSCYPLRYRVTIAGTRGKRGFGHYARGTGTLRVMIGAAARLDVNETAIRKRLQRGSLGEEPGGDGRAYVHPDLSRDKTHPEPQVDSALLVEDLREPFHYRRSVLDEERDARRRADPIIAQLTQSNVALAQRAPELPSARPPESSVEWAEDAETEREEADMITRSAEHQQSWWRRVFD